MKRIFLLLTLILMLPVSAFAVNPDDFIDSQFETISSACSTSVPIGSSWVEPNTGMKFVWVPGGCFQMGSNHGGVDEKPVHEICVDGFWIGKYEVTNAQYWLFAPKHVSGKYKSKGLNIERFPVARVSWKEAKAFAAWMSSRGKAVFRLPTEAEWEYAARLGYKINTGRKDEQKSKLVSVDSLLPDRLGIHGLEGNAGELCEDVYNPVIYSAHGRDNPVYRDFIRGYSAVRGKQTLDGAVSLSARGKLATKKTDSEVGFRLVRTR